MASTKSKTAGGSRKTVSGKKKAPGSAAHKKETGSKDKPNIIYTDEILFLLAAAFSLILLFSNFRLCGSLGNILRAFMRGMFGNLGYLFPFFFFGAMVFFISNRNNPWAMLKLFETVVLFWVCCGILQLFCWEDPERNWDLPGYYEIAQTGIAGGVMGGIWNALLRPVFGFLGMAVVLAALLIICIVLITGKSFFQPVRDNSERLYYAAKEDYGRRKEYYAESHVRAKERKALEREEHRRQMRTDRKENGMVKPLLKPSDLSLRDPGADNVPAANREVRGTEEGRKGQAGEFVPVVEQLGTKIHNIKREGEPELQRGAGSEMEESWPDSVPGEADPLFVRRDHRTLQELKAVERQDSPAGNYPLKPEILGASGENHNSFKKSSSQAEIRTVHTASGKVIEAEIRPEDLVPGVGLAGDMSAAPAGKGKEAASPALSGTGTKASSPASVGVEREAGSYAPAGAEQGPDTPAPSREYQFPPLGLLSTSGKAESDSGKELKETALKLQQTLKSFGVSVTITDISRGPTVTRYEISPEQGVKVSKIVSLTDDIKLNLAAEDIRIEAPIPGKAAVGIEVPNKKKVTVYFRDLVDTEEFRKQPSKLAFAVGKDLSGKTVVTNLGSMPHLLIAGATGSGKSVCINTIIMSLLYKAKPDEVKLIMIDPKVVELSVYNGIPHLLIPVVTDPKKAAGALNWAVAEMTDRYKKFAEYTVRDLRAYNEKIKFMKENGEAEDVRLMPQIVIIVDELADLMMVAPGEVEDAICRLAQLARAAGIHLVIATQRPSVNVITGLIKANMPSRIAFAVTSGVDSRTILDMVGAEKLLGKGDMLFAPSGYPKPVRLQGAFLTDEEISGVVSFIKDTCDLSSYGSVVDFTLSQERSQGESGSSSGVDDYFVQAGKFVIEKEKASSGMLQRAFKIGFNRAARIIDQLCEAGVVGEDKGTKPRDVLMTEEEFEQYIEENQL